MSVSRLSGQSVPSILGDPEREVLYVCLYPHSCLLKYPVKDCPRCFERPAYKLLSSLYAGFTDVWPESTGTGKDSITLLALEGLDLAEVSFVFYEVKLFAIFL